MDGLHDIMRCLILWIPLQEPNKIKNEVPQKFGKNLDANDTVPRHHLILRQFWVQIASASFLAKRSLISKSAHEVAGTGWGQSRGATQSPEWGFVIDLEKITGKNIREWKRIRRLNLCSS